MLEEQPYASIQNFPFASVDVPSFKEKEAKSLQIESAEDSGMQSFFFLSKA
jgi:hypothetical protein